MKLYNSLTKRKEIFKPIDPHVIKMYVCGPTVYDRPHIGNARSAVVYDVLYRLLKHAFKKVIYVRNITDVDDKIIKACKDTNTDFHKLTNLMTDYYHQDIRALNCLDPTYEPKATQYITAMIKMIEDLIVQGHAYEADSHVLFSVETYAQYGQLSNRSWEEMIAGARVEVAPFKKNPADFVLWKPSEEVEFSFDSPWGRGRPGWHIECSAMSYQLLGEQFDIHGGGADLKFPHHENEIAQSKCSSSTNSFANYWVHNGFLLVDGNKMSKSLNNFKTVRDLLDEGVPAEVLRYFYLTTHYGKPIDFNEKAIEDSQKALKKFQDVLAGYDGNGYIDQESIELLYDDLNTVAYLAKMHEYVKRFQATKEEVYKQKLSAAINFIGLKLDMAEEIPYTVIQLADKRIEARKLKQWDIADNYRNQIAALGYEILDAQTGYKLIKK